MTCTRCGQEEAIWHEHPDHLGIICLDRRVLAGWPRLSQAQQEEVVVRVRALDGRVGQQRLEVRS